MSNIKSVLKNNIRIYCGDLTKVSQKAINNHKTYPLPSICISTAIASLGMLSAMKKQGKTIAYIKTDGPIKNIIVESNVQGDIRALIGNPFVATEYDEKKYDNIPIEIGIGKKGILKIVHQIQDKTFGGEVDLVKGNIVSDLTWYFDQSEQIKTAVITSVKLKSKNELDRSWGAIFQLMPNAKEEDIKFIEKIINEKWMSKANNLDDFINKIDGIFLEKKEIRWKCKCSRENLQKFVDQMDKKEKEEIRKKEGKIEITCNFCNKKYKF